MPDNERKNKLKHSGLAHMNSVLLDAIAGLVILAVGVICSIVFDGVFHAYTLADKTEVLYALCTFVLPIVVLTAGWLALKATFHDLRFEKIAALSNDLKIHAKTLNTAVGLVNDLLAKQSRLAEIQNEIITDATSRFVKSYVDAFKIEASTFTFKDRQWSLFYNSIFWQSMIEAQASRKPIWVFATHTLDPTIWNDDREGRMSLDQQSDFISARGKVIRLFVRKVEVKNSKIQIPENYLSIMREMREKHNIETYYVEIGIDFKVDDATWVPGLQIYMKWPEAGNFCIGNGQDEADEFKKAWRVLEARAIDPDDQPIPSESSARTQTEGSGSRLSLSRMVFAVLVQTNGFASPLCSRM
jgi:hypothetical protein